MPSISIRMYLFLLFSILPPFPTLPPDSSPPSDAPVSSPTYHSVFCISPPETKTKAIALFPLWASIAQQLNSSFLTHPRAFPSSRCHNRYYPPTTSDYPCRTSAVSRLHSVHHSFFIRSNLLIAVVPSFSEPSSHVVFGAFLFRQSSCFQEERAKNKQGKSTKRYVFRCFPLAPSCCLALAS